MLRSLLRRMRSKFAILQTVYQHRYQHRTWTRTLLGLTYARSNFIPGSLLILRSAVALDREKGKKDGKAKNIKEIIDLADKLYEDHEVEKLYELLMESKDCEDDEILWRLARAMRDMSKITVDPEKQRQLVMDAFQCASRALRINDQNFASHKWYAILLDATAAVEGTKSRLLASTQMLEHFQIASELNPMDATTYYLIGLWYFSFADLAWYERKVCALVFETPPQSSYDLALKYFKQADEAHPDFYSKNTLMIGKTLARMKKKPEAIHYLKKVLEFPLEIPCDVEAQEEAIQLLRSLGVDA